MLIKYKFICALNLFNIFILCSCDHFHEQNKGLPIKAQHNSTGKTITLPGGWKVSYNFERADNGSDVNSDHNRDSLESIDEEFKEQNKDFDSEDKEFDEKFFDKELDKNDTDFSSVPKNTTKTISSKSWGTSSSNGSTIALPGEWKVNYSFDGKANKESDLKNSDEEFEEKDRPIDSTDQEFDDNSIDKEFDKEFNESFDSMDKEFEELDKNDIDFNDEDKAITKDSNNAHNQESIKEEDNIPGISIQTDPDFDSQAHFDERLMKNDHFLDGLKVKWEFTPTNPEQPGKIFDKFYMNYDPSPDEQEKEFLSILNQLKELDKKIKNAQGKKEFSFDFNGNKTKDQFNFSVNDPKHGINFNLAKNMKLDINLGENKETDEDFETNDKSFDSMDKDIKFDDISSDKDFEELNKDIPDINLDDDSIDDMDQQFLGENQLKEENQSFDSIDKELKDLDKELDIKEDKNFKLNNIFIKRPGIEMNLKYAIPRVRTHDRPISRTHIIRTKVEPQKNNTEDERNGQINKPKIVNEDIQIYEYSPSVEGQSMPIIIKSSERNYTWLDYAWVALAVVFYFFLLVLIYIKFMKTSDCSGSCRDCKGCDECCKEEEGKGLIKDQEDAGWFDTMEEVRMFKLKIKRNRKLSNYERLRQYLNK